MSTAPRSTPIPNCGWKSIYQPAPVASAEKAAAKYGGRPMDDLDAVLSDPGVDAVVIATPTDTHVDYIERPPPRESRSIAKSRSTNPWNGWTGPCRAGAHPVPFMLGFNRRFDPDNAMLRRRCGRARSARSTC
jgi:myo-inositol 2-dehydrogenase / D-chiro-inositol 1-dehydrogenase